MPRRRIASRSWYLVLAAFVGLSLWPLFARCPPMQDYPQHLVLTQVLANIDNPASDSRRYFETHLGVAYSAFYVITLGLARLMSIESAGRVTLALYPLLVLVMVWRIHRRAAGVEPWGAVLFFPLSFNQQYFLGNVNYLLALPLVILALLDYEEFLEAGPRRSVATRQAVWPFLLAATHPFALVAFIGLALVTSAWWWWSGGSPGLRIRASCVVCLSVGCLVTTYAATRGAHIEMTSASVEYLPPAVTREFLALMVNDMQGLAKPHVIALTLWSALLSVSAVACVREWRSAPRVSRLYVCLIVTLVVAVFVVPFRVGPYTYLNMRCAAILYFLIALLAARTPLRTWWRASVVALAAGCMILSLAKQAQISRELARIAPIANAIPKHARILPLVFDNDSTALDWHWFDIHQHAYLYYHLMSGGGFSPYLPTTALHPVRYQPDARRPAPGEYRATEFKWKAHAADYEYFVALNAPAGFVPYLIAHGCELVAHSGPWLLFKRGAR